MSEKDRIDLLNIVMADKNKITVKDAADIFLKSFMLYFKDTKTGKKIKDSVTESEYIAYVTGMVNTLMCNLYINASKNQKEFEERLKFAQNVNKDVISYMHIEEVMDEQD